MTEKKSFKFKIKEFFRKLLVGLKRNPQNVAFVILVASFLTYSLNLTKFSNTTAYINISPMGLCEFVAMLFSVLAIVCFLNSFPKRKKIKWVMVGVMFAMIAAIIAVDIVYYIKVGQGIESRMAEILQSGGSPAEIAENLNKFRTDYAYCYQTKTVLIAQIVLLAISALLVAFLPLYRPLLKKINTSVEVEGNENLEQIEIEADA